MPFVEDQYSYVGRQFRSVTEDVNKFFGRDYDDLLTAEKLGELEISLHNVRQFVDVYRFVSEGCSEAILYLVA